MIGICKKCGAPNVGLDDKGICVFCDGTFKRPKELKAVEKPAKVKVQKESSDKPKAKTKANTTKKAK